VQHRVIIDQEQFPGARQAWVSATDLLSASSAAAYTPASLMPAGLAIIWLFLVAERNRSTGPCCSWSAIRK
jgi:hypothetical protein